MQYDLYVICALYKCHCYDERQLSFSGVEVVVGGGDGGSGSEAGCKTTPHSGVVASRKFHQQCTHATITVT